MYYTILIIFLIYLSEIGAYFWHRWGTHSDIIPHSLGVQRTHNIHHSIIDDKAHGDFFYVIIGLLILFGVIIYLIVKNKITYTTALMIYLPILFVFLWNWYIHSAYHTKDHWLLEYQWFKDDKRIHMQHHINPNVNYGIVTHFSDVIFDTFDYGFTNCNL